jgi:hypothetical protein
MVDTSRFTIICPCCEATLLIDAQTGALKWKFSADGERVAGDIALAAVHTGADLQIEPVLVYVSPRQRGNGYGIDLSIACAWICEDLLEAIQSGAIRYLDFRIGVR